MSDFLQKPSLRFKGFTEPWEQRKLASIAIKLDNLRVPVSEVDRVPGSTPYYGANGIQGYVQGCTHKGEFILVAEDGANDLKNYPVQYVNGEVWVNNHAHVLQGKLDLADTRYLGYTISQTNIEPFLVGGGRAKLNASIMMKIMVPSPQNTQEQQRIGLLFDSIDSLITLHQRKLDTFANVKTSLLSKMFPTNGCDIPDIRFKGFTEPWEQRKFNNLFQYERPDEFIVKSNKYFDDNKTPVLTANKGFILGYTSEIRTFNNPCIIFDDFTLDSKYVDFPFMVKSSAIKILTSRDGNNLRFCYERLNSEKIENLGHARHYISIVQPTQTAIPTINEQTKIADMFIIMDNLITLHQRKPQVI